MINLYGKTNVATAAFSGDKIWLSPALAKPYQFLALSGTHCHTSPGLLASKTEFISPWSGCRNDTDKYSMLPTRIHATPAQLPLYINPTGLLEGTAFGHEVLVLVATKEPKSLMLACGSWSNAHTCHLKGLSCADTTFQMALMVCTSSKP